MKHARLPLAHGKTDMRAPLFVLLLLSTLSSAQAEPSGLAFCLEGVSRGGFFGHVNVSGVLSPTGAPGEYAGRLLLMEDGGTSAAFFHYDVELQVIAGLGLTTYEFTAPDGSFSLTLTGPVDAPAYVGMGSAAGVGEVVLAGTV